MYLASCHVASTRTSLRAASDLLSLKVSGMKTMAVFLRLRSIVFTLLWRVWLLFPSPLRRYAYIRLNAAYETKPWVATRLAFGLRLKWARFDPYIEATNMRFVSDNTTIPIPRVLDVLPSDVNTRSRGIIIMEWIDGETLSSWIGARTKWPEEYHRHIALLTGDEPMSKSELDATRAILKNAFPTVDISDGQHLVVDLRNAVSQLRTIAPSFHSSFRTRRSPAHLVTLSG